MAAPGHINTVRRSAQTRWSRSGIPNGKFLADAALVLGDNLFYGMG